MNAPRRSPRRPIDGVLLLDKPLGYSSNQALQAVKRIFAAEKAGHTGTLDPLATGLLPLCFGEATKFSSELLDADKRYLASIQLGLTTETADAEGKPLLRREVNVDRQQIENVLAPFVGCIEQLPPMYSALKRDGKPLYEYARAGIEVERKPRKITIYAINLLSCDSESMEIDVSCSKGTYIRTLAEDIGEALGCGAHLRSLRRTGIGSLEVSSAYSLAQLEQMSSQHLMTVLQAPDSLLKQLPVLILTDNETRQITQGQAVSWAGEAELRLRVYSPQQKFIGVCRTVAGGLLQAQRLVATN